MVQVKNKLTAMTTSYNSSETKGEACPVFGCTCLCRVSTTSENTLEVCLCRFDTEILAAKVLKSG